MEVFTAASDGRIEFLRNFISTLRHYNKDCSINVIPFFDECEEVRRYVGSVSGARVCDVDPAFDEVGKNLFGLEEYRPGVHSWRYFRKLNCFSHAHDKFVFFDCNILAFSDPVMDILEELPFDKSGSGQFFFYTRSAPHRTINREFDDWWKLINPTIEMGYNAGLFASRRSALDSGFCKMISGNRNWRKLLGRAPEQSFLMLYAALAGIECRRIPASLDDVAFGYSNKRGYVLDKGDGANCLRLSEGGGRVLAVKFSGSDGPVEQRRFFERVGAGELLARIQGH